MIGDDEQDRLLAFARGSASGRFGFGWLDDQGRPDDDEPVHTWITTRMTHVFALAHLRGVPGSAALVRRGVEALCGPLRDEVHGGWYAAVARDGSPAGAGSDDAKAAYAHAFVVLAASSAVVADAPGAQALLAEALRVVEEHFLDDDGRVVDVLARDFSPVEDYRGANSSMHVVEAFLAAGDVTGEVRWHERALVVAEHLVHDVARAHGHLLPEHFTSAWEPVLDYNAEDPGDPFRPFGCTPGHLLEWARLLLHLEAALSTPPPWLAADAAALFATAMEVGWCVDGAPGFVYTVDWDRRPVVRHRMHWVHAEGVAAAAALHRRTGEPGYAAVQRELEEFAARHLLDRRGGSWHHELDEHNRPSREVWRGKPDVYHAYQALLLRDADLAPSLAVQLARSGAADGTSGCPSAPRTGPD